MTRFWARFSFLLLVPGAFFTAACGSANMNASNRKLQSIAIMGTLNGPDVVFTATGSYNAPPFTMNPLPTSWSVGNPPGSYQLTTQPFVLSCSDPLVVIIAISPANPNAPSSGPVSSTQMVAANTAPPCPNE